MNIVDTLLELQKMDCAIRDIKQELHDIPERQKQEETRLEEHNVALADAETVLHGKQASIKDVELDIDASREKISKFRSQQLDLKTNKEFRAMEDEIATLEKSISVCEDKQLLIMEDVESAMAEVESKRKALAEENTAVEDDKKIHGERAQALEGELKAMESAREESSHGADEAWLKRYNMIIERKDRALVLVENGICGGCHMKMPPAVIHAAKARAAMVFCDHCGRLLY